MKDKRGRPLSEEDILIWRRVARTARPLPGRAVPNLPAAPEPPPEKKKAAAVPPAPRAAAPKPVPRRPAAPAEISGERRVRRGKLEVEATLDLHGMSQAEARAAVGRFLARHRAEGARTVLIVTGKGRSGDRSSPERGSGVAPASGLLRRALPDWLLEESAHVSGYAQAHARHGGAGAFYVRLRRPQPLPA